MTAEHRNTGYGMDRIESSPEALSILTALWGSVASAFGEEGISLADEEIREMSSVMLWGIRDSIVTVTNFRNRSSAAFPEFLAPSQDDVFRKARIETSLALTKAACVSNGLVGKPVEELLTKVWEAYQKIDSFVSFASLDQRPPELPTPPASS